MFNYKLMKLKLTAKYYHVSEDTWKLVEVYLGLKSKYIGTTILLIWK